MELAHHSISEGTKHIIDATSILTVFGTLAQVLPPIAALLTIIWTLIRIYESTTVQKWIGNEPKGLNNK
jgi:hypothetical protein